MSVGPAGGQEACRYCGQRGAALAIARDAVKVTEDMDGETLMRQTEARRALDHLFVGVDLLPWKAREASALWRAARASGDAARLRLLTLALAQHFENAKDPLRQRAILEGALDVATAPADRHVLYAALARGAARAGDPSAAEAWLARCDARPRGLASDTAYRHTRAYLDTLSGQDPQRVLQTIGGTSRDVMLHQDHEAECAALRAHAWERLGRMDMAVQALDELNQRGSSLLRYACARFVERHADLGLCSESFPRADGLQRDRGVALAAKAAGAPLLALALTAGHVLLGLILFASIALFGELAAAYAASGFAFMLATVFLAIAIVDFRKARRAKRIRAQGVQAAARIIHARGTKQSTNGLPQLSYRVLVLPPTGVPFEAHTVFHADAATRERFGPGSLAVVRMDPADHRMVQMELD